MVYTVGMNEEHRTMFEHAIHVQSGLTSFYVRPDDRIVQTRNLRWLLNHNKAVVNHILVRELTEEEKSTFPNWNCVLEVEFRDGYKFSSLFSDREVLRQWLNSRRKFKGQFVTWFNIRSVVAGNL